MLQQIDTMIGFAAVMLLYSLLVTILVQVTVELFNLRGRNLLWGLAVIVEHALPGLTSPRGVARQVLCHKSLDLGVKLPVTAVGSEELIRILGNLAKTDKEVADALGRAHEGLLRQEAMEPVEAALHEAFPGEADRIESVMEEARTAARKDMADLKAWYHMVMDRTSERFVRWTRGITVFFALLLAVGVPVDSLALLKRISTSVDARARLVQTADATVKAAEAVGADAHLATRALAQTKTKHDDVSADVAAGLDTRAQGVAWIQGHVPPDSRGAFTRDYEAAYDAHLLPMAQDLLGTAATIRARLDESQLTLAPGSWPLPLRRNTVLGILMSVLFLSLGAPFWFNMLRQLGNLRPVLANKVDQAEKKS